MNKTFVVMSFLFFISVFTISPAWSLEDRIIISEIDGNLFSALINSTIIMVNGNAIQKIESQNPEQIGKIFIFEEKQKDSSESLLNTIATISVIVGAALGFIIGGIKFYKQRSSSQNLEFSKSLIEFENKWVSARTDWKNTIIQENISDRSIINNCIALCAKRLSVLDSLAFLSFNEKIDGTMLEYFQFHFREGMLYEKWMKEMESFEATKKRRKTSNEPSFPQFSKYIENNDDIDYAPIESLDVEFLEIYKKESGGTEFKIN